MLDIPFGTGVVAAFLFLIFELIVFPVLIYSTAALASVLLYHHTKEGNGILIKTLKFPYWNEGLLHRQRSHLFLLLFRIVAIAIPVYLDFGLEAHRNIELRTYRHAFVVGQKEDWLSYENKFGISLNDLNGQSGKVFRRCTKVGADGWLEAFLATLTFQENGDQVVCIPNTQRKVFRSVGNMDALQNYSKYQKDIVLKLSWVVGPREAFPISSFSRFDSEYYVDCSYTDDFYLLTSWTVVDEKSWECFPISKAGKNCVVVPIFVCQNVTGSVPEYYVTQDEPVGRTNVLTSKAVDELLTRKTGILNTTMNYMETLEFENDGVISAAHLANPTLYAPSYCDGCGDHPFLFMRRSFYATLESFLYTRIDNATLRVPGAQFGRTVISGHVVLLGMVEITIVLLFGICMWLYLWSRRAKVQNPNTLNGLSEVWAASNDCSEFGGRRERRRVTLRMKKGAHSNQKNLLEPLIGKSSSGAGELPNSELHSTEDETKTEGGSC